MNFPELRALLVEHGIDPLSVTCSDYDDAATISRAISDRWVLWHHDDAWEVGGVERGRFLLDSRYPSEAAACERLEQILVVGHPVRVETPDERARSEAITREASARARARIAEMKRHGST